MNVSFALLEDPFLPLKAFLIQLAAKQQRKLHLQQLAYYRQSEINNAAFDLLDKTVWIIGFYAPNQLSQ